MIKIFNTLSGKKEDFEPMKEKNVRMFVCGPTVYDSIHIGNARTFVIFDVVAKYLRHKNYEVNYIQNITDIDDKIIARAKELGKKSSDLAREYEDKFIKDITDAGVTAPAYYRATEHIDEVVSQVEKLREKGSAYLIENDGWYFDLSTFPEYGKLSGRTREMAEDAVSRIDQSIGKRNSGDFCLWKLSKEDEPSWDTPLGKGRPGWHIEDTAITEKYFGPQYDLHGAGQDLMFPHHEAEIAQQESTSGLKPFVKYWMHTGFLVAKDSKMSKSKGNFLTLNEALESNRPEALRLYFLSAHYRSPLSIDEKSLPQADSAVKRIADFMAKLETASGEGQPQTEEFLKNSADKFYSALDDDFNTALAIGSIFDLIRNINPLLVKNEVAPGQASAIKTFMGTVHNILGIVPPPQEQKIPAEILELVDEREKYRLAQDWSKADEIRKKIEDSGYKIEDTAYGPLTTSL